MGSESLPKNAIKTAWTRGGSWEDRWDAETIYTGLEDYTYAKHTDFGLRLLAKKRIESNAHSKK